MGWYLFWAALAIGAFFYLRSRHGNNPMDWLEGLFKQGWQVLRQLLGGVLQWPQASTEHSWSHCLESLGHIGKQLADDPSAQEHIEALAAKIAQRAVKQQQEGA